MYINFNSLLGSDIALHIAVALAWLQLGVSQFSDDEYFLPEPVLIEYLELSKRNKLV